MKYIEEDSPVGMIYMDLNKTFDKVPHGRLCQSFQSPRQSGKLDPTLTYLQRVMAKGCLCDFNPLTNGIPQGSTLTTMLFAMYVEGLIGKFVGDTKISGKNQTVGGIERIEHHPWRQRDSRCYRPRPCIGTDKIVGIIDSR